MAPTMYPYNSSTTYDLNLLEKVKKRYMGGRKSINDWIESVIFASMNIVR
jgi:hypothetical protein